jgi:hypothetical protein
LMFGARILFLAVATGLVFNVHKGALARSDVQVTWSVAGCGLQIQSSSAASKA